MDKIIPPVTHQKKQPELEPSRVEAAMLNILEDTQALQENLRIERDRIRAIFSSMGEGLLVVDNAYRIVRINPAAERLLAVSEWRILNQDIRTFIHLLKGEKMIAPEDSPLRQVFELGTMVAAGVQDNFSYKIPSGKRIPVAFVATPLWTPQRIMEGLVVVFRDVTEEKMLDEAKDRFISVASHQIRTPITSIRWYSEMLLGGDAGKLTKKQKMFSNEIHDGVIRLAQLIDTLLAMSRIEAGRIIAEAKRINMVEYVKDLLKEIRAQIKAKELTVAFTFEKSLPPVSADPTMLQQVLENLLFNSISYTGRKGHVAIHIARKDNEIVFSIMDSGIGIPKDQQRHIFEKFFRAMNARLTSPDGSGLGLNLSRYLVELWGGTIWFESEEHKGTKFYFTIPLSRSSQKE